MAKMIKIITILGCIHYAGGEHAVGDPAFGCEAKEAKRLIDLGVAAEPGKIVPPGPTKEEIAAAAEAAELQAKATAKAELLAAIAAAQTPEELLALLPENEPEADVAEAFALRHAELEKAQ